MSEYRCINCNKYYTDLHDYKRHLNRKKPCNMKMKYQCVTCNGIFTTKPSLNRHILNIHKDLLETNKEIEKDTENTNLDNISNEKINTSSFDNNTIGNENTIATINGDNNIANSVVLNINVYGKENVEYITNEKLKKMLLSGNDLLEVIKHKHFNINHKENFNFHLLDKFNHKYTMVKNQNTGVVDWIVKDTDIFFSSLINRALGFLEERLYDNVDDVDKEVEKKIIELNEMIEKYEESSKTRLSNKYKKFYRELIFLSINYMDLIMECKNEDKINLINNKEQKELLKQTIDKPQVKKGRGRPRKT